MVGQPPTSDYSSDCRQNSPELHEVGPWSVQGGAAFAKAKLKNSNLYV